jgi:hypothetical protein
MDDGSGVSTKAISGILKDAVLLPPFELKMFADVNGVVEIRPANTNELATYAPLPVIAVPQA